MEFFRPETTIILSNNVLDRKEGLGSGRGSGDLLVVQRFVPRPHPVVLAVVVVVVVVDAAVLAAALS